MDISRKSRKTSRKSRKTSRKSRKGSRKTSRKSRKGSRKTSRKSRKGSRKTSRKSRKGSRKGSRKTSRKSRKGSRKTSRKERKSPKKFSEMMKESDIQKKMYENIKKGIDIQTQVGKIIGNDEYYTKISNRDVFSIMERILNLNANELREKHFNRKTLADKFKDLPKNIKSKAKKYHYSPVQVKKAFDILIQYKRDSNPTYSSYNPFLDMKYRPIYRDVLENMIENEIASYSSDMGM